MNRTLDESTLSVPGRFDEGLEGNLGGLLAPDQEAVAAVREVLGLASALGPQAAAVLGVVKAVAVFSGWAWQKRRPERAKELFLGLYQRQERMRSEYVSKEEFPDLLNEALRRIAEQPDEDRRRRVRDVFLKILDSPKEHVENRRFLRLADELPAAALKVLDVALQPGDREDMMLGNAAIL